MGGVIMRGLKGLILIFTMLAGCTPSDSVVIVDKVEQTVERVSRSATSTIRQSREAAVEILSHDAYGNPIGGTGAYVKYKKHHFVLTAAHVVANSGLAMVSHGSEKIIAEVVYLDEVSDIAVLKIEGMFTRKPLLWRTVEPSIGTEVVYTGYPNRHKDLTIEGRVSGYSGTDILIHSYAWSGSSGSVVLDQKGRIVGVLSAVDIGYAFGRFPQIVEDIVIVIPIRKLKVEDLVLSLSN
jgi:S1-C subfamily serine protease